MRHSQRSIARRFRQVTMGVLVLACVVVFGSMLASAQESDSAGIIVSGKATPKDVGLPSYPGAKPYKESGNDSDSARLGLWGGSFGFKLAVVKMESNDPPEKITQFYRKALGKYGDVLDCTNGRKDVTKQGDSDALTCDNDKPEKGALYEAGTRQKQHIVAIQQNGAGSRFQLIYVWASGN